MADIKLQVLHHKDALVRELHSQVHALTVGGFVDPSKLLDVVNQFLYHWQAVQTLATYAEFHYKYPLARVGDSVAIMPHSQVPDVARACFDQLANAFLSVVKETRLPKEPQGQITLVHVNSLLAEVCTRVFHIDVQAEFGNSAASLLPTILTRFNCPPVVFNAQQPIVHTMHTMLMLAFIQLAMVALQRVSHTALTLVDCYRLAKTWNAYVLKKQFWKMRPLPISHFDKDYEARFPEQPFPPPIQRKLLQVQPQQQSKPKPKQKATVALRAQVEQLEKQVQQLLNARGPTPEPPKNAAV